MIINNGKFAEKVIQGEFEFVDHGFNTGKYNMDFDVEYTKAVEAGEAKPIFRVYGWTPWCLSLGANQKIEEINAEKCEEFGYDIVRRPTGGRAVLHANEITYSVIMPLPYGTTVQDVYRDVHTLFVESFQKLGAELDFQKSQPDFKDFYSRESVSVSCFASSARYEIEKDGKKLVGSAQRLFGGTLLQHGSILIGAGHEQLAEIANVNSESKRDILRKYISDHSTTLSEVATRPITYAECARIIEETIQQ